MSSRRLHFITLFLAMLLLQCSNSLQTNSDTSDTEANPCIIAGQVTDQLNNPVSGSVVRLRSYHYVSGDSLTYKGRLPGDRITSSSGRFEFDSIPPGQYLLEAMSADSLARVVHITIGPGDSLKMLPPVALIPMARVTGTVSLPAPGNPMPRVQVVGLELTAPVDVNGHFALRVPSGWCRLMILNGGPNAPDIDTVVYLLPSQRLDWTPPAPTPPCDSLACDTLIVRGILDSNSLFFLPVCSVTVVESGRVNALHLYERGLRSLPPSIGLLTGLVAIDIRHNQLEKIPDEVGRLKGLTALYADSCGLRTLPATMCLLESLTILTLADNQLSSLPEPVSYLTPSVLLDLSGNMLCNLGDFTARWANAYDSGWEQQQVCR